MSKKRRMDSIVPQEQSEKFSGTYSIPEEEINFFPPGIKLVVFKLTAP